MTQIKNTLSLNRQTKAATIIQDQFRTHLAYNRFHVLKFAVDVIRSSWKRNKSVKYIKKLYLSLIHI